MVNKVNMEDVEFPEEDNKLNGHDLSSDDRIVVELGLTKRQVKHLKWVCQCWLEQYEKNEGSPIKEDISGIKEALEEI